MAFGVFGLTIVGLLWMSFGSSLWERQRYYRFDRALWLASKPEARYYMATYLVDHRMLIGKTADEIVAMLGQPNQGPGGFDYCLGPERGSMFRIDDDWLELDLDQETGRVTAAYIGTD
jgi:hypothetical protein